MILLHYSFVTIKLTFFTSAFRTQYLFTRVTLTMTSTKMTIRIKQMSEVNRQRSPSPSHIHFYNCIHLSTSTHSDFIPCEISMKLPLPAGDVDPI